MRFILPILLTVVLFSSCTSEDDDTATPTSPIEGTWRQLSFSLDDATVTLPDDYGLTLKVSADSIHYYKHDTLINEMKYKISTISSVNVITSTTTGYENYYVAYKLNTAGDTLNLYTPSFATTVTDNSSAIYVKVN